VLGGVTLAVALVGSAAACGGNDNGNSSSDKCGLKLAFVGALTGGSANLGINMRNGAQLAIDEYNAKNKGCEVTYVQKDSQGKEDVVSPIAKEIVKDQKLIGSIGPAFSGETQTAMPTYEEGKLPMITPSATRPSLSTNGWKTFHRAVANDDSQGPAAANYIKSVLNAQKVFVMDDQSAYGTGIADNVKKVLGSLVVDTDKVQKDVTKDFAGSITKIRASGATAVFYGGYYQEAGLLLKQMRGAGLKDVILVAGDGVADAGLSEVAGKENAAGTVVTCPCAPATAAKGNFLPAYKAKFNQDAGSYSDVAYDAANIFLKGIEAGNTTREKMNAYLGTIDYEGVANKYKFTATGELDPSRFIVWAFKFDATGNPVADQEAPTS
jgi:branched-chain amino acid transport system substrate-binding protein